jgi:hypothetical protein
LGDHDEAQRRLSAASFRIGTSLGAMGVTLGENGARRLGQARDQLRNGLTSNCVRGVTKVAFVGGVVIGSGAEVVETGGGALAAGWGIPAAAGAAGAVGISEAVNLAPQANRLWSNFQSGSQDVIDGCL